MERRRANFKVCIELVVAAPEVLSRTALASPPWPINMERLGPGKLLEPGREKHIKKGRKFSEASPQLPVCKAPCFS